MEASGSVEAVKVDYSSVNIVDQQAGAHVLVDDIGQYACGYRIARMSVSRLVSVHRGGHCCL